MSATACTISHDGRALAYVQDAPPYGVYTPTYGTVTDWHGTPLGTFSTTSEWEQHPGGYGDWYTMRAVAVRMRDGSRWYGRYNRDGGNAVSLRPVTV